MSVVSIINVVAPLMYFLIFFIFNFFFITVISLSQHIAYAGIGFSPMNIVKLKFIFVCGMGQFPY